MASFGAREAAPRFYSGKIIEAYARDRGLSVKNAMAKLLRHEVWPERFRRHRDLLKAEEQARLLDLPVFIAGCGGLGGEVAALLARLGAGNILLCDRDRFEESNLNRQRFCSEKTLGREKAPVTAEGLKELASFGDYVPLVRVITPDNIKELIAPCEIVIDCLDSVSGKKELENAARESGKAFLHGAVLHHEGFAFLASPAGDRLTRLYGEEFNPGGAGSVLGHVVAGVAALMVSLFTGWLAGRETSPLLHCDFSVPEFESFRTP